MCRAACSIRPWSFASVADDKVKPIGEGIVVDGANVADFVAELHQLCDKYCSYLTNIEVLGALELVKLERHRIEADHLDDAG